jgi:hypothetical protein
MAGTSLSKAKIPPQNDDMSTLPKWNPFRDLEDIQNRRALGSVGLRWSGISSFNDQLR